MGVLKFPEEKIVKKWRLEPGKMLLLDLQEGRVIDDEEIKKLLKSKEIGEDEEKIQEKKVQTITDDHIKSVDEKVSLKEKEIMTI